jgi:UPF0176 protein
MEKIIIFYKFVPLMDPHAVRLWQKSLCEKLNLLGRIIISPHGINATVGGEIKAIKAYVKETKSYISFNGLDVKWSNGQRNNFPKLSVKVRDELVAFGAAEELKVDDSGIVGGGVHLTPTQVHELVAKRGDVVFFDGRNAYEAAVGRFKDAVVPNIKTTHDFIAEIEKPEYELLKDKPIVTYCTGGIRCEVLSALMKNRGFKEVYQIDGGIIRYGETYADDGLWSGSLHVFDGRTNMKFSSKAIDIGACIQCNTATSHYVNCQNPACHNLLLLCPNCAEYAICSNTCQSILPAAAS